MWSNLLICAAKRRTDEEAAKAILSLMDMRRHDTKTITGAMLNYTNLLRYQRITPETLELISIANRRRREEERYGMKLDDPRFVERVAETIAKLRQRRQKARNQKK